MAAGPVEIEVEEEVAAAVATVVVAVGRKYIYCSNTVLKITVF